MSKTITTGFISATINGIALNSGISCNAGNYNNYASRNIAYVVMHYTGNAKDTAKANVNYFATSGRGASAHFFVDDTEIYQSVELRDAAWHCGATTYKHASCRNGNSIGIEMCCTAGNHKISETTKTNAAYLCAYICNLLGITAAQVDTYVLRHYDVTGKNCPAQMVSSASEWTAFKTLVRNILNGAGTTATTASATPSAVSYAVGDKVTVNGNIYANGNGGNAIAKSNSTMYVTEVLSSTKYKYYIGVATKKGGTRQGWASPDALTKA